jgi:cytochrome oxidase Cu insertion factor (SCO1/SenC/PrrC family)
MHLKPYHVAWILAGVALLSLAGLHVFRPVPGDQPQAVAGVAIGGAFTLTDHDDRRVTEKSWPGKYLLVYFGFTHCPDICPLGLNKIADALEHLPSAQADKIQALLITVDPARDDAPTLKNYVALFHPNILGLTGSEAEINHVKKLYRVYAQKQSDGTDYMVNHSGFIYLMDPKGENLAIFPHEMTSEQILAILRDKILT